MRGFWILTSVFFLAGTAACSACEPKDNPPLGIEIDRALAMPAAPSKEGSKQLETEYRRMLELKTSQNEAAARDLEETLMKDLGFEKVWLRCGYGTFLWKRRGE